MCKEIDTNNNDENRQVNNEDYKIPGPNPVFQVSTETIDLPNHNIGESQEKYMKTDITKLDDVSLSEISNN